MTAVMMDLSERLMNLNFDRALELAQRQWRMERKSDSTIKNYTRNLRRLHLEVGGLVGASDERIFERLTAWRDDQQDLFDAEEISASKIATDRSAMVAFYKALITQGKTKYNPAQQVQSITPERGVPHPIPIEDFNRICAQVDTSTLSGLRDRAYLELLRHGLRQGEVRDLTVGGVEYDESAQSIYLTFRAKGRANSARERGLPMVREGAAILALYMLQAFAPDTWEAWEAEAKANSRDSLAPRFASLHRLLKRLRDRKNDPVFITDSGRQVYQEWVNRMFNGYRDAAGVDERWTVHSVRHRFCTTLLEQDIDPRDSMALTGHKDIRNLMIYTEVTRSRAHANIAAIGTAPVRVGGAE